MRNIDVICAEKISDYWARRGVSVTLRRVQHDSSTDVRTYLAKDGEAREAPIVRGEIGLRSDLRLRAS